MRYLVQFLVPALIVVVVVYLLARTKRGQDEAGDATEGGSDTGTFILILVIGATVAGLSFFLLQGVLN
jgi:Mn2+/Fe2+ NRAMP family transporter